MRSVIARRGLLGRIAALPIIGAGTSIFARRADAATASILRQIDEVEARYQDAQQAFDAALAAHEAALPKLHWTLDITNRLPRQFRARIERGFHNSTPKRYVNKFGYPDHRYIATVESLMIDLAECPYGPRGKMIRRMMRRAGKHEAAVAQAEVAFNLDALDEVKYEARRCVSDLAEAIFARPATTLPEIRVQARMLRAYATATSDRPGRCVAGTYGAALAANLDRLGEAA